MTEHDRRCKWPEGRPCRKFSLDGTLLGAHIAHTMGAATLEAQNAWVAQETERMRQGSLTGMTEEQAEWEGRCPSCYGTPDSCAASGCGQRRTPVDMHEPRPYLGELDWHDEVANRDIDG